MGTEVVNADIDNPESMKKAFEGAYAAFCVTFFWAHLSPEKEIAEAKAMALAAKTTGLRHVIWSTLEDMRLLVPLSDNRMPTLQGKYKVLHSDGKGESDHFFADAGVGTTFLLTSLYWDNFIYFGMGPKKGPKGKLVITFPMDDKRSRPADRTPKYSDSRPIPFPTRPDEARLSSPDPVLALSKGPCNPANGG